MWWKKAREIKRLKREIMDLKQRLETTDAVMWNNSRVSENELEKKENRIDKLEKEQIKILQIFNSNYIHLGMETINRFFKVAMELEKPNKKLSKKMFKIISDFNNKKVIVDNLFNQDTKESLMTKAEALDILAKTNEQLGKIK